MVKYIKRENLQSFTDLDNSTDRYWMLRFPIIQIVADLQ